MVGRPKIVLHAPISDETLLEAFVESCLREGVVLIAIVGPGCERIEDVIDELIVRDGSDERRAMCTSSHPNESVADVLEVAALWDCGRGGTVREVRL